MDILEFSGEFRWLSNFHPCNVIFDGITFTSVENAYVAAKTKLKDRHLRELIATMTPGQAKRFGREIKIRLDWDEIKLAVMRDFVRQKFQNKELSDKLAETGNCLIVEGNTWGDTFWGVCAGVGQNNLGKIIMEIRNEINQKTK